MFQAITRPIQYLIISYLRYVSGSPSLTDTKHDHYVTTLVIEHSYKFVRENILYSSTHAYVFNKLGIIHPVNYHVGELTLADSYQGIELSWRIFYNKSIGRESFELRFDKRHKDLVYNSYLPYVESTAKEMTTIPEVHIYSHSFDTWETKPLEHHSTFETIAMKEELKRGLIHDLDMFVRRKDLYDRAGRPWTRSYLLYGPPGTGKTSLVVAMAKYLNFDVYDLQLSRAVESYFNPRKLLSGVMNNSILLVEDIDEGFKVLASTYLGLSHVDNDEPHRLYPDIKRLIDGQVITPAQVTVELMESEDVDVVLEGLVRTLESLTSDKIDDDEDEEKHLACLRDL
ncbi:hypothetical protein YC2023_056049 [Brassica napus]